jgi:hypothetical protein
MFPLKKNQRPPWAAGRVEGGDLLAQHRLKCIQDCRIGITELKGRARLTGDDARSAGIELHPAARPHRAGPCGSLEFLVDGRDQAHQCEACVLRAAIVVVPAWF